MSGQYDLIRDALAAKLAASAGCATAGLRRALADVDSPLAELPEMRVLNPSGYELTGRPTAWQESYRLTIPAELVAGRPGGERRSDPAIADIARAVQVEFQTGVKLGLATYVDECVLASWSDGLQEYAYTDLPGARFTFQVDVTETLGTPRTA
jgi:hypothetical protein